MVTESFQQYQLEVFFGGFGVGFIVTVVITFIILIIWWWVASRRQAAEEREVNREIFRQRAERERQQGKGKFFSWLFLKNFLSFWRDSNLCSHVDLVGNQQLYQLS